jgi:HEPN domain-containing protein/predicted nucleotidyltransferase
MKTQLPKRSLAIKPRLDSIIKVILDVAKDKIAMIILFGSHARGDWVEDEGMDGHTYYTYQSDLDIMVIMKKAKYATGNEGIRIEERINKILDFLRLNGVYYPDNFRGKPPVTLIFESTTKVNKSLEKGRYFYTDVKKEGVILYDSGEFQLAEAKDLTFEEWKEIAQEDYNLWFYDGTEFLIDCKNALERKNYRKAAFELHQATENFYNAILLVFSGYKPRTHDLKKLKGMVNQYDLELLKVFPLSSPEQIECFKLLRDAYVKARYDKTYKITEEQLAYLIDRVERLEAITEKICLQKLGGG